MTASITRDVSSSAAIPTAAPVPVDESGAAVFAAILASTASPIENAPTTKSAAGDLAAAGPQLDSAEPTLAANPTVPAPPPTNAPVVAVPPFSTVATLPTFAPRSSTAPAGPGPITPTVEPAATAAAVAPSASDRGESSLPIATPGDREPTSSAPAPSPITPTGTPELRSAPLPHDATRGVSIPGVSTRTSDEITESSREAPTTVPANPSQRGAASAPGTAPAAPPATSPFGSPAASSDEATPPSPETDRSGVNAATHPPRSAPAERRDEARAAHAPERATTADATARVVTTATAAGAFRPATSESVATPIDDIDRPVEQIATPVADVRAETPTHGEGSFSPRDDVLVPVNATAARGGAALPSAATLDGILDQVRLQASRGATRIEIAVDPPQLGHLAIRLVLRGGRLIGDIAAETREVAKLLESGLDRLRQTMREAGVEVDSFEVRTNSDARDGSRGPLLQEKEQSGNPAREYRRTQTELEDDPRGAFSAPPPDRGGDGRIDVMV